MQIWVFKSWIWNSKIKYHRVSLEHNEAGCHARPNKRVYHSLNDICTQCSNLYGDNYGELYTLCRYVFLWFWSQSSLIEGSPVWHYGLWSFQAGVTKRLLQKNQHKVIEFWVLDNGELSKVGHHFSNKVN